MAEVVRENVVEALEDSYRYSNVEEGYTLVPQDVVLSTITLLKKQEPKAIKPICKIIFDIPYYFCGDCKTMLNMYSTKAKFCSQCGQVVQWE